MTKLRELKKRLMENAEFREEYALADQEYALVAALIRARIEALLTAGRARVSGWARRSLLWRDWRADGYRRRLRHSGATPKLLAPD